jgi:hypothetical protein
MVAARSVPSIERRHHPCLPTHLVGAFHRGAAGARPAPVVRDPAARVSYLRVPLAAYPARLRAANPSTGRLHVARRARPLTHPRPPATRRSFTLRALASRLLVSPARQRVPSMSATLRCSRNPGSNLNAGLIAPRKRRPRYRRHKNQSSRKFHALQVGLGPGGEERTSG